MSLLVKPLTVLGWASGAVILDLVTKHLALSGLKFTEVYQLTSFFNLVLVFNQGAACSLFSGAGPYQGLKMIILTMLALIPLMWFYLKAKESDRLFLMALGLIFGGAAGNVVDRARYKAVVDFLDFHVGQYHWPAFNLADVWICLGAGLMIWSIIRSGHRKDELQSERTDLSKRR
ncbi:MAG: signal peptidase II [Deltaproteobacteria bacterium]|jgi:signal peptidase II|nr:signal peptidase II [Deltaproteobacteria bacterium]